MEIITSISIAEPRLDFCVVGGTSVYYIRFYHSNHLFENQTKSINVSF